MQNETNKFTLKRIAISDSGAYGVLLHNGIPFATTLEHTFSDVKPIIPEGVYVCKQTHYNKGNYTTYEVPVSGHSRILLHKGNTEADSEGCILVGEMFSMFGKTAGIGASSAGFQEFMIYCEGDDTIELTVVNKV